MDDTFPVSPSGGSNHNLSATPAAPDTPVPWWQDAVIYQIYPRSFRDLSGDGVGDLAGIQAGLDHLVGLGVDAIWLSPVYPSPNADFGYDVADYTDVDPTFGSLADLDELISDCHDRGLRVILDWVPNHTSDQHQWFRSSRSSRTDPRRDWYIWRDPAPDGGPPNNWIGAFIDGGSAWTHDATTGQYYLHLFLPGQPDLNWANPEVVAAMESTLRFWLDRGVDGFRCDVVHAIGKDPALPDTPPELAGLPQCVLHHDEETHPILRRLRRLIDSYPGARLFLGETALWDTELVAGYYGAGDELHLAFNFVPTHTPWEAAAWRAAIESCASTHAPISAWPTWVLSNHDLPRHRTRYGTEARARAAAVLLLGLRGTPFLYAGEELGLENAVVPDDAVLDPGGRDGERAPIPWTPDPGHGWAGARPWLPWPPEPQIRNVATQAADADSTLNLYRRLTAHRRVSFALRRGAMHLLDLPAGVVGWIRSGTGPGAAAGQADTDRLVLVNFTEERVVIPSGLLGGGRWRVAVSTNRAKEGHEFSGELAGDEAVWLTPAAPDVG